MLYLLLFLFASLASAQCFNPLATAVVMPAPYTLPAAQVGVDYRFQFQASNGQAPYYFFSLNGEPLPSGLTLSMSGELTGRPTFARPNELIRILVRDSTFQNVNHCEYRLTIVANQLTLASTTLPRATAGLPYSTTLVITGAVAPVRLELLGGTYPPGIQGFSNGVLSGTPTTPGTYTMRFRVTDANNNTVTSDVTLTVDPPSPQTEVPPLPAGEVGLPYSATVRLSGNPTFQLLSGQLPPGLVLSPAGLISGTPSTAGNFPFTLRASTLGAIADLPLTIRIAASTQPFTLQALPLTRFPIGLPATTRLTTISGQAPIAFTLLSGTIPAGLAFSPAGELTGTPRGLPGAYPQRWLATDATGRRSERDITLTIDAPQALPPALVRQPYSQRATGPGRFSLAPGHRLPLGLTLSPDGTLAGTPLATGEFTFALRLESDTAPTELRAYRLDIAAQPPDLDLDTLDLPAAALGLPFQHSFLTHPAATTVQVFEGPLPPGLSLQGVTLSGTPTTAGFFDFVLDLSAASRSVRRRYTLAVIPPGQPQLAAVAHAASYAGPAIAPGQILTLFGAQLDRLTAAKLDNRPAHILYSTPNQTAIIAPSTLSPGTPAKLTLTRAQQETLPYALRVIPALPGIFTQDGSGRGPAAALNQDASFNTAQQPAAPGSIVVLYGTGLGPLLQPLPDGQPAAAASLALAFQSGQLTATVEGQPATILYAGSAPGLIAGVDQINLQLPPTLPAGEVRVQLTAGSRSTPEFRIHVRD